MDIAQRIKELREARGWSQYELAKRCEGLDKSYIGQLEAGRIVKPGLARVLSLAKGLDVSPGPLLKAAGYSPMLAADGDGIDGMMRKVDWDVVEELAKLPYQRQRDLLPVLRSMKHR